MLQLWWLSTKWDKMRLPLASATGNVARRAAGKSPLWQGSAMHVTNEAECRDAVLPINIFGTDLQECHIPNVLTDFTTWDWRILHQ